MKTPQDVPFRRCSSQALAFHDTLTPVLQGLLKDLPRMSYDGRTQVVIWQPLMPQNAVVRPQDLPCQTMEANVGREVEAMEGFAFRCFWMAMGQTRTHKHPASSWIQNDRNAQQSGEVMPSEA